MCGLNMEDSQFIDLCGRNVGRGLNGQILNKNTDDPLKCLYYKGTHSVQSVKFLGPETHLVCTCLVSGSFVLLFAVGELCF